MRLSALLPTPARWPLAAAVVSAAMLATAHLFQRFGYPPCPLCLRQREAYWGALAVIAVGLLLVRLGRLRPQVLCLLLGAVFLAGATVAGFHAGVEWRWWPGPAACGAIVTGPITTGDLTALLEGAPVRAIACDEVAWRMILSMAGWNALISAALAAISFGFAFDARKAV